MTEHDPAQAKKIEAPETREETVRVKLRGAFALREHLSARFSEGDYAGTVHYGIRNERLGSFSVSYGPPPEGGFPRSSIMHEDGRTRIAFYAKDGGEPSFEKALYQKHPMKFQTADEIAEDCIFIIDEVPREFPQEEGLPEDIEQAVERIEPPPGPVLPEEEVEEEKNGKKKKKVKAPRKPQRKTRTRAEIKERDQKNAEREYQRELAELQEALNAFETGRGAETIMRALESLTDMAQFLSIGTNQQFRKRFINSLTKEAKYAGLRKLLGFFYISEQDRWEGMLKTSRGERAVGSEMMTVINARRMLFRLAREVVQSEARPDAYRSSEARELTNTTSQSALEYGALLFPEFEAPESYLAYVATRPPERWVDVGAGENYMSPVSLMNELPFLNPNVKIVGADLLYKKGAAGLMDKIVGRDELLEEWAEKHELVGVAAQELSSQFTPESFDGYLSCLTYDKFNTEADGIAQALREAAYVLKPNTRARIWPFPEDFPPDHPVITKYFEVIQVYDAAHQGNEGRERMGITLLRKRLSPPELEELAREITAWKEKFAKKNGV